jgi:polar amino acid transport system substrate-binding protein
VIFTTVFILAACASPAAPVTEDQPVAPETKVETTLEKARREGVIRVGFANESPFAYATPEGTLTGESVEVARAIFKKLGIDQMEGVLTEFGSLIPGLQAKRFDAITAGMFILPARCEQVLFANPDYQIIDALIVKKGNPLNLHSFMDIVANPNVKVGTGAGYSSVEQLKAVGVTDDQMVLFPDGPSGIAGLQAGRIDVWTSTAPASQTLQINANDPTLEMADPYEPAIIDGKPVINYGGVAFRMEDLDLREAYNVELAKLEESGALLEIISEFEGFGTFSLPGGVTAERSAPMLIRIKRLRYGFRASTLSLCNKKQIKRSTRVFRINL